MISINRELVFLILQFLDEEKFKETVHKLEKESGFFFNIKYFEETVINGEWEEVENYLSGFTKPDDNRYSMKVFFEIRKQKYLEALDRRDHSRAVEILTKDLKIFSSFNEDLFKEITMLLTLPNFRENEQLSKYGDTKSARRIMVAELKKLIEANPLFHDKLRFPALKSSRLRTLINQSLNWQHQLCKNPKPNPDIKTLFVDHICIPSNAARTPSPVANPLMSSIPKVGGFTPMGAPGPFQHTPAPLANPLSGWMANSSSVVGHQVPVAPPIGLTPPNHADSELLRRSRTFGVPEEVSNMPVNVMPAIGQSHGHPSYPIDDLPKVVVANLSQGSAVKSFDFHPSHQTILIVGTNIGEISVWEVSTKERLVVRNFKVWDLGTCSMTLQASLANENVASVNRVKWSPDGALLGVAYSKNIVHLYTYYGGDDIRNHLEIDAHTGSVSDLAFSHPNKQLCVVTCGEDKTIKVWDAATGAKQFSFDGHEAPVYSVCPHSKENIQFFFSTATDGKIKAWLYDNLGSRVDYDAPGHSCTTMAYSSDGTRLFSCGTNKDGESFIMEWNESEGSIKRKYQGLGKWALGVVQFDTAKNRILAAGDEFHVKYWDMDNPNLLDRFDANGGLQASPCIRFNKDGSLLAVSTSENGVKIIANDEGIRLLVATENRAGSASKAPVIGTFSASSSAPAASIGGADRSSPIITSNAEGRNIRDLKSRITEEKIWKLTEINEQSQLRSLKLPDNLLAVRIIRLIYTSTGNAILALAYNAVHKLWKWRAAELNVSGKATIAVPPQLWQPPSGFLMTNDITETNLEEAVPCFALSKNDSYVLSASGGKISLFNLMTFKTMTTFMAPPPAATSLAFHPLDNNVVAVGMEDSTIHIYNVRVDEVKSKLKGHQKRVTGLAFSNVLDILVSAGADAQICVWTLDVWERKACKSLQIPPGRATKPLAQTRVQFHPDQTHLLVVHETQIGVYETPKLECVNQWFPRDSGAGITDATYSCDGQSIYASFDDGTVCIFTTAGMKMRCRINQTAYLPPHSSRVHPLVITAHPTEPNQFALGLTDGGVHVLEPLETDGKWGTAPPQENGVGPSMSPAAAAAAAAPDQTQR